MAHLALVRRRPGPGFLASSSGRRQQPSAALAALVALVLAGAGLIGCSPRVRQRDARPPPMVEPRADRPDVKEEPEPDVPEHFAPPPAYGNKVVMAGREEPAQKL